jgi:hypothetical protein
MDAHRLEHPPLATAARIAGLAPAVFHRRFTAIFSTTPRSWLEARRLDHTLDHCGLYGIQPRLLSSTKWNYSAFAISCSGRFAEPPIFSALRPILAGSPISLYVKDQ